MFVSVPCYQPQTFQKMRADLASMWSPTNKTVNPRRFSVKGNLIPVDKKSSTSFYNDSLTFNEDVSSMKVRNFVGSFIVLVCNFVCMVTTCDQVLFMVLW